VIGSCQYICTGEFCTDSLQAAATKAQHQLGVTPERLHQAKPQTIGSCLMDLIIFNSPSGASPSCVPLSDSTGRPLDVTSFTLSGPSSSPDPSGPSSSLPSGPTAARATTPSEGLQVTRWITLYNHAVSEMPADNSESFAHAGVVLKHPTDSLHKTWKTSMCA
jgi:hypothetical protein